jgi:hypothetical protein
MARCPACGREFDYAVKYVNRNGRDVYRPRKYCGQPDCTRTRRYDLVRAWCEKNRPTAKPNPQGPLLVAPDGRRVCDHCGNPFEPAPHQRGRLRYCSAACRETKRNEHQNARRKSLAARVERLGVREPAREVPPVLRAENRIATSHAQDKAAEKRKESFESGKRWGIDPCTSERLYEDDEREFLMAMETYKRRCRRPFPTWSEALQVLVSLGYRKVEQPGELPGC